MAKKVPPQTCLTWQSWATGAPAATLRRRRSAPLSDASASRERRTAKEHDGPRGISRSAREQCTGSEKSTLSEGTWPPTMWAVAAHEHSRQHGVITAKLERQRRLHGRRISRRGSTATDSGNIPHTRSKKNEPQLISQSALKPRLEGVLHGGSK